MQKTLLVLFASEAGTHDWELGNEMKARVKAAAAYLRANPEAYVFFAKQAAGFYEPDGYSRLVWLELFTAGISLSRVCAAPAAFSTLGEIDAAEKFIAQHGVPIRVVAIATWNHIPRIWALWRWHHGRSIECVWVRYWGFWTWVRVLMEPPKFLLAMLPQEAQEKIGSALRRAGILR